MWPSYSGKDHVLGEERGEDPHGARLLLHHVSGERNRAQREEKLAYIGLDFDTETKQASESGEDL